MVDGGWCLRLLYPPTTIHYPPPTIHYPPPTIHYPPPTIHYPPPTIHYPPPTIHYPPPTIRLVDSRNELPPHAAHVFVVAAARGDAERAFLERDCHQHVDAADDGKYQSGHRHR